MVGEVVVEREHIPKRLGAMTAVHSHHSSQWNVNSNAYGEHLNVNICYYFRADYSIQKHPAVFAPWVEFE